MRAELPQSPIYTFTGYRLGRKHRFYRGRYFQLFVIDNNNPEKNILTHADLEIAHHFFSKRENKGRSAVSLEG